MTSLCLMVGGACPPPQTAMLSKDHRWVHSSCVVRHLRSRRDADTARIVWVMDACQGFGLPFLTWPGLKVVIIEGRAARDDFDQRQRLEPHRSPSCQRRRQACLRTSCLTSPACPPSTPRKRYVLAHFVRTPSSIHPWARQELTHVRCSRNVSAKLMTWGSHAACMDLDPSCSGPTPPSHCPIRGTMKSGRHVPKPEH
jgi:hypothetical protein